MSKFLKLSSTLAVIGLATSTASAQFNNAWVTFVKETSRIQNPDGSPATQITTDGDEKDYAWGDVNNDGWIDVVVVRKNGWSQLPNKRVGYLMMNEYGNLVDRTAQYASDSDLPGDFGLMTPTAAREVQLVDINNDGWLDMITAATNLTPPDPKSLTHPRVYRNKGVVNGVWQGFKYEDARFPQLYPIGSTTPVGPRVCGLAVGDVNGDGFVDMYYADYDETEPGPVSIPEPAGTDTNDRLLINDGAGNFVDSLETRMTAQMLFSTFGTHALIRDMNGDGYPDIIKNTALSSATYDSVSYQNPANPGTFNLFQQVTSATATPYHFDVGDLNNDGRPDLVVGDDGQDHIKYNTGNDALGRVIWSSNINWSYLSGSSDGGFPGTTQVADLNNDGWLDIVVSDVDVDLIGCNRLLKIMHNPGGPIGANIVPRLEAQNSGTSGWKGAVGMTQNDLRGTWDCAVFDIDNDGDLDIVQGKCTGTDVWINQLNQAPTVTAYCFGDGTGTACPCANNSAVGDKEGCLNSLGLGSHLSMSGSARVSADTFKMNGNRMSPGGPALYFQANTQMSAGSGISFGDGKLCVNGTIVRLGVKFNNLAGESGYPIGADVKLSIGGVVNPGDTRTYQVWYRDAAAFCLVTTFNLSNGVQAVWAP